MGRRVSSFGLRAVGVGWSIQARLGSICARTPVRGEFRVCGLLGFRVPGFKGLARVSLEFRVQGSGCRVQGSGFKVQSSGFWGLEIADVEGIQNSGHRVLRVRRV